VLRMHSQVENSCIFESNALLIEHIRVKIGCYSLSFILYRQYFCMHSFSSIHNIQIVRQGILSYIRSLHKNNCPCFLENLPSFFVYEWEGAHEGSIENCY
jgi:hypothetical protein